MIFSIYLIFVFCLVTTSDENWTSTTETMDPMLSTLPLNASKKCCTTKAITTQKSTTPMTTTLATTTMSSTTEVTKVLISMTITIDGEYDEVVGVDKQMFLNNVKKQLAYYLRVPLSCIVNMDSKPGSIIVIFEMIPSLDPNFPVNQEGLISAKHELEQQIRTNRVHIKDSKGEVHKVISSIDNSDDSGQRTENTGSSNQMSYLVLGLTVGSIVIMIILIILTACAVRSYMYRKYLRQIRPRIESEEILNDIPSRDGIRSANTLRLMTGLSREDTTSGLYSYDSGVWVAPQPEITVRGVPERAIYLPPNDKEIPNTPKTPLKVVCLLTIFILFFHYPSLQSLHRILNSNIIILFQIFWIQNIRQQKE